MLLPAVCLPRFGAAAELPTLAGLGEIIMSIPEFIQSWPVIIQGALGSALFWLILVLGQKSVQFITSKLRKDKETAEFFALMAWSHKTHYPDSNTRAFFTCLYSAIHYLVKAIIIIIVAWLSSPLSQVFWIAGNIISIYFLFRALSSVPHLASLGDVDARLDQIFKSGLSDKKDKDVPS
jgi:hypothetical protein